MEVYFTRSHCTNQVWVLRQTKPGHLWNTYIEHLKSIGAYVLRAAMRKRSNGGGNTGRMSAKQTIPEGDVVCLSVEQKWKGCADNGRHQLITFLFSVETRAPYEDEHNGRIWSV